MWFISGKQGQGTQYLIYQHNIPTLQILSHPKATISQFNIIDQDRKQVSREAREATHIRRCNPACQDLVSSYIFIYITCKCILINSLACWYLYLLVNPNKDKPCLLKLCRSLFLRVIA